MYSLHLNETSNFVNIEFTDATIFQKFGMRGWKTVFRRRFIPFHCAIILRNDFVCVDRLLYLKVATASIGTVSSEKSEWHVLRDFAPLLFGLAFWHTRPGCTCKLSSSNCIRRSLTNRQLRRLSFIFLSAVHASFDDLCQA